MDLIPSYTPNNTFVPQRSTQLFTTSTSSLVHQRDSSETTSSENKSNVTLNFLCLLRKTNEEHQHVSNMWVFVSSTCCVLTSNLTSMVSFFKFVLLLDLFSPTWVRT